MMIKLNNGVSAASRKEACELIRQMMLDKDQIAGIGNDDIERLYRYFLPAIPKQCKTAEQWVCKAVPTSKDSLGRPQLELAHAAEGRLVGSDGHRIHWIEDFHATGFYDPKSMHPVEAGDLVYPEVSRVIPSNYREADFEDFTLADLEKETLSDNMVVCKIGDAWFQHSWVIDAANSQNFKAQHLENKILIKSEFGHAVIMMLRK